MQIRSEFKSEFEKNEINIDSLYDELEILKKQKDEEVKKEIWEIGLVRNHKYLSYRNSRTVKLLKINKKTVEVELNGNIVLKVPKSEYEKDTNSYEMI